VRDDAIVRALLRETAFRVTSWIHQTDRAWTRRVRARVTKESINQSINQINQSISRAER